MARVPSFLARLEHNDPDFANRIADIIAFAEADGALDAKTKTLMSLVGDAILNHPEGVTALAALARRQGATEEEIAETVRMVFMIAGIPALATAQHAFRDQ